MPRPYPSEDDIKWAVGEWSKCTTLEGLERVLVSELGKAIEDSLDRFYRTSSAFCEMFAPHMRSAILKARIAGIGKEWPA